MLGLFAFFYACSHFGVYLWFDIGFHADWFIEDLTQRPFIAAGLVTLLMLVPLAITSTDRMMRRLGKNWRRLHRLVYVIGCCGLLHYWWLLKEGRLDALGVTVVLLILLGYRVLAWSGLGKQSKHDDGMETPERSSPSGEAQTQDGQASPLTS